MECFGCRWDAALQLCRFLKLPMLWACLAAAAMKASHLEHATAAFAAIDQVWPQNDVGRRHQYQQLDRPFRAHANMCWPNVVSSSACG